MKIILKLVLLLGLLISSTYALANELNPPTRILDGTAIQYDYTSGRSYHVKFEKEGVSYQYLTGSKPSVWWGPFPYTAFEVEKNTFLAAWFEEGYGDYVTLHINFNTNLLYGSAILQCETVHFHGAKIVKVTK
jgi:hypothetical protein